MRTIGRDMKHNVGFSPCPTGSLRLRWSSGSSADLQNANPDGRDPPGFVHIELVNPQMLNETWSEGF